MAATGLVPVEPRLMAWLTIVAPRGQALVILHKSESPTILGVSVEAPTGSLVSAGFASLPGLPIFRTCKTSQPCQAGKHPDLCSTTRDKPRGGDTRYQRHGSGC